MSGTLYGLGIGPGDPELITVKALRLLERAPVIAYPAPEKGESLARSIVASYLSGGDKKTEVVIRMPLVAARFPAQRVYDRAATSGMRIATSMCPPSRCGATMHRARLSPCSGAG